jgi:uncharacterized protein with HEPN domain
MTHHNDLVYLRHMRDHATEALNILGNTPRDALIFSRVLQLALLHLVEIVGEAAGRVSPTTRARLDAIPWREAISMRNRIIHGYDSVDVTMLWDTVVEDFPPLITVLSRFLDADERNSDADSH